VTTVAERVREHVDTAEITRQASEIRPGDTAQLIIGTVFWAIGWLVAQVFRVVWKILAWCAVATRTGWREAHGKEILPSTRTLMSENQALRNELQRTDIPRILSENTAMLAEIDRLRGEIERMRPAA